MRSCKALIIILLALIVMSEEFKCTEEFKNIKEVENTNTLPYNYKFTMDCMGEDCNNVDIYAKNIYLNPPSKTLN